MSLVLNGTTQYVWRTAPVVGRPFFISAWFKSSSDSALQALWGEGHKATTFDYWRLALRGDVENDPVGCTIRRTGVASALTSSGYTAGQWQHAIFIEAGTQDHRVYINGGSEGTDVSNDQGPLNLDTMGIGALPYNGGWANFFSGKIAEVAIWNGVIPSAGEIAFLAGGGKASSVQPTDLKAYWPLLNDANDDGINALHLTEVATPSYDEEDHPAIGGAIRSSIWYYNNFLLAG